LFSRCDFVYHLAGINRPEKTEEFKTGNVDFTYASVGNYTEVKEGRFLLSSPLPHRQHSTTLTAHLN